MNLRRWLGTKLLKPYIRSVWELLNETPDITAKDAILLITNDHVTGNNREIYSSININKNNNL